MPYEIYEKQGSDWKKVAGTDYSKVKAKTAAVAGATEAKALEIDGTNYNLPSGGSGSYLPLTGGTLTGNLNVSTSYPTLILDADNAMYAQRNGAAASCMNMLQMNSGGIELTHLVKSTPASGPEIRLNNDGTWSLQATTAGGTVASTITGSSDGKVKLNGSDIITQEMLDAFFDRIYPIGITYVQYTATDNPNTLFPGTTWQDITSTMSGRYPMLDSDNPVGTFQDQALPNILGNVGLPLYESGASIITGSNGAFSGYTAETDCTKLTYGSYSSISSYINFNAGRYNAVYKNDANVQPYTVTVRLWKRTA